MTGQQVTHYTVLEKLGEGGMGAVYKAEDVSLKRTVALKFLHAGEDTARLLREAQAAASLIHPSICTVFEVDAEHGFLAMELVEGMSLRERIQERPLKLEEALRIAAEVAAGLQAAHAKGIVHRDIKAGNILLTSAGQAKLTDFGLALMAGLSRLTKPAMTMGTPGYMAPEQARGETVDRRADIWSLGVVLYEMVTGQLPFKGNSEAAVVHSILHDEPEPLTALRAGLPLELDRIVTKCLAKDPGDRYQHIEDLLVDLRRVRPVSGMQLARPAPWSRRLQMAAGYVVVAAVAAAAMWLSMRTPKQPEAAPQVLTRLTSDPGLTFQPAISPGGELLAYASDRSGRGDLDIWVQGIGERQAVRLTDDEADDSEPAFSPDGRTIAFRSERDGGGIYLVPALGGEARRLVSNGRRPKFSPDGKWIAYWVGVPTSTYLRPGWCKAYVVPAEGGAPKGIRPEFSNVCFPLWLPDERLLFLGMREAGQPSAEVVDWWTTPLEGGDAVKTGFMAAATKLSLTGVFQADGAVPVPIPEAVLPQEPSVLFHAKAGDATSLWQVPFSWEEGKVSGLPRRLTVGTSSDAWPAVWHDGSRIAFSSLQTNVDIWSLSVDPRKGTASGSPERLTDDLADDLGQDLSSDGTLMAFMRFRSGNSDLWLRDLRTMRESLLFSSTFTEWYPKFAPDNAKIAFASAEGPGRFSAFLIGRGNASAEMICDDCGIPSGWSADGKRILLFSKPDTADAHLAVLDLRSKRVSRLAGGSGRRLYGGQYSPDGKWILFLEISRYWRTYVAPEVDLSEKQWIRVTSDESIEDKQCWSPDGRLIYFVSDRDGFRCLWARPFNPAAPGEGKPIPVLHSHQSRRSIANVPVVPHTLAVAPGRLTFSQNDWTANIWMMDLKPRPAPGAQNDSRAVN